MLSIKCISWILSNMELCRFCKGPSGLRSLSENTKTNTNTNTKTNTNTNTNTVQILQGAEWTPFSFYSRSVLRTTATDSANFTCQVFVIFIIFLKSSFIFCILLHHPHHHWLICRRWTSWVRRRRSTLAASWFMSRDRRRRLKVTLSSSSLPLSSSSSSWLPSSSYMVSVEALEDEVRSWFIRAVHLKTKSKLKKLWSSSFLQISLSSWSQSSSSVSSSLLSSTLTSTVTWFLSDTALPVKGYCAPYNGAVCRNYIHGWCK